MLTQGFFCSKYLENFLLYTFHLPEPIDPNPSGSRPTPTPKVEQRKEKKEKKKEKERKEKKEMKPKTEKLYSMDDEDFADESSGH